MYFRIIPAIFILSFCLGCKGDQGPITVTETPTGGGGQMPQGVENTTPENTDTPSFGTGNVENKSNSTEPGCTIHEDCPSGHCADTPSGGTCTEQCETKDDCLNGYLCKLSLTSAGLQNVCVHPFPAGCKPCTTADDCGFIEDYSVGCHDVAGNSVCLATCNSDLACPTDFACSQGAIAEGIGLCVPLTGSCTCKSKYAGLQGTCTRSSAHGVCEGTYTCSAQNTASCSAEVPIAELCNQKDDDCDGEIDESGSGPTQCSVCDGSCLIEVGAPFDLSPENSNGLSLDEEGNLILGTAEYESHFIWIANSGENTLSKLDTITGSEIARYRVCSDPSRTAVDLEGDCWVVCRGDGKTSKISNFSGKCVDKNGNGVVDTSKDANGDGVIQTDEMLPEGEDECVQFTVQIPQDSMIRAAGVDKDNHAWVGLWSAQQLQRLEPENGAVVQTISIPVNPYGLAIDQSGIIWVAGRGGQRLVRVVPETGEVSSMVPPSGCIDPYGITIDHNGNVWIGNNGCGGAIAWRYEPSTGNWASTNTDSNPRGIAASVEGFVYVANDGANRITKINAETMGVMGYVELGGNRNPVGVAIDAEGYVWAVNQNSSTVTKADPNSLATLFEKPVGNNPYTYSDMTGYSLMNFTAPSGSFRATFESPMREPVSWDLIQVDAELPGNGQTWLTLRMRAANQLNDLANVEWAGPFGPFPPDNLPADTSDAGVFGLYSQVEVTLHSKAGGMTPKVKSVSAQSKL